MSALKEKPEHNITTTRRTRRVVVYFRARVSLNRICIRVATIYLLPFRITCLILFQPHIRDRGYLQPLKT